MKKNTPKYSAEMMRLALSTTKFVEFVYKASNVDRFPYIKLKEMFDHAHTKQAEVISEVELDLDQGLITVTDAVHRLDAVGVVFVRVDEHVRMEVTYLWIETMEEYEGKL